MTAPLRLVPRSADRAAAEVVLVEAVLTGLPPGGRVLVVGDAARTAWLADALEAVEVYTVSSPLPAGGGVASLFAPASADEAYDAAVVDAGALSDGAAHAVAAVGRALSPFGRLLVQVPGDDAERSLGAWVRLLAGAGMVLRDVREPDHGGLTGSVFVCEVAPPERG